MSEQESYTLGDDPRLARLVAALQALPGFASDGSVNASARGLVVLLLRWTAHHAPNGDLSIYTPEVLASATEWDRDPNELVAILQQSGFLDARGRYLGLKRMFSSYENFIRWAFEE